MEFKSGVVVAVLWAVSVSHAIYAAEETQGSNQTGEAEHQVAVDKIQANKQARQSRSVEDLMQARHVDFNRTLTIESALNYSRYDRSQLTLNGFLALDAIFLGNLAVEGVASDTLTYSLSTRYGITNRLVLNLTAPFVFRTTNYAKGGVGGVATATSETSITRQPALGDISFGASLRLFPDYQPMDWVWSVDFTAPTGESPYGVPVRIIEKDAEGVTTFSVPDSLPTGSGVWALNTGVSFIKTSDPAILFGNLGFSYNQKQSFSDVDSDPVTRTPGQINLGNGISYGLGLAFAMNESTSLSLSFSHRLTGKTKTKTPDNPWAEVVGSDANSAMFNIGVTQGVTEHLTLATAIGIGLTDDAPDFTFGIRLPYRF